MRAFSRSIPLVLALAGSLAAAPMRLVWADAGSDSLALKKFEEGKTAYDAGKFEEALIAFQASMAVLPSPNSRLYIARCFRAMGKFGSAYVAFKLAAREAQERLNTTGEKRYKATRDTAASEMAEIEAKVPHLTLAVPSDVPDGFVVTLDGTEVSKGAWGTSMEMDAGKHEVSAKGPRRKSFSKTVTLEDGGELRVDIDAPRIPTGKLVLTFANKPGGLAVRVDGVPVEPSKTESAQEVDVGAHTVEVQAPGYDDFSWKGTVADQDTTKVDVKLDPSAMATTGGGTPKWLFFGVAATSVVALGAGTLIAMNAKSRADTQTALDPAVRDPDEKARIGSAATRANILFVAGGVLALGAGVLLFTTKWSGSNESDSSKTTGGTRLTPWASPWGGGLGATGAF